MSIRLEVVVSDEEYDLIRDAAREKEMTIAGWVRETLTKACCRVTSRSVERKLAAIRAAECLDFPTADMDRMLFQIGRGYSQDG